MKTIRLEFIRITHASIKAAEHSLSGLFLWRFTPSIHHSNQCSNNTRHWKCQ